MSFNIGGSIPASEDWCFNWFAYATFCGIPTKSCVLKFDSQVSILRTIHVSRNLAPSILCWLQCLSATRTRHDTKTGYSRARWRLFACDAFLHFLTNQKQLTFESVATKADENCKDCRTQNYFHFVHSGRVTGHGVASWIIALTNTICCHTWNSNVTFLSGRLWERHSDKSRNP